MACAHGVRIQVVVASVSDELALYEPDTGVWSGFVPDFLKLISNELGFEYDIVDERSLCDITALEYFRAFLRKGRDICVEWNSTMAECCAVAASEYDDDLGWFYLDANGNWQIDSVKVSQGSDGLFQFVYKDGAKRGRRLSASLLLNYESGEHPRTMEYKDQVASSDVPRFYGDAMSTTPMYSEEVETLVFTTTEQSMWNLFKPFSWQLWVAIVSMVRNSLPYHSVYPTSLQL
jgi:hypothetical protein